MEVFAGGPPDYLCACKGAETMRHDRPLIAPNATPVARPKIEDPASAYWSQVPAPVRPAREADALEQMFAYYDAA